MDGRAPSSPTDLADNKGARALITHLPPMQCMVADIAEDVIVGVNYIKPLQGGFATVGNLSFFRLAVDRRSEAPTVLVPLIGETRPAQSTSRSTTVLAAPLSQPLPVTTVRHQRHQTPPTRPSRRGLHHQSTERRL